MLHQALPRVAGFVVLLASLWGIGPAWAQQSLRPPTPNAALSEPTPTMPIPAGSPTAATGNTTVDYVLGVGDKVKVVVFGESDLSGEFEIGSTGNLIMPLVGDIPAVGQTLGGLTNAIKDKLSGGFLRDPQVSLEVLNYRPFYILGEVTKPGSYPFVNRMTIVNAVALAGGYTYRANGSKITIVRANDADKVERSVREDETVLPGDVIRVPERFF